MIRRSRQRRRGTTALEFALILPVLFALLAGTVDYGWFFLRESLINNALRDAVRVGSFQSPSSDEAPGTCASCLSRTADRAVSNLAALGIPLGADAVTPSIVSVSSACVLVLEPAITHTPLVGLVPNPTTYSVRLVGFAQGISGC